MLLFESLQFFSVALVHVSHYDLHFAQQLVHFLKQLVQTAKPSG